jgi:hypothetical protein
LLTLIQAAMFSEMRPGDLAMNDWVIATIVAGFTAGTWLLVVLVARLQEEQR